MISGALEVTDHLLRDTFLEVYDYDHPFPEPFLGLADTPHPSHFEADLQWVT